MRHATITSFAKRRGFTVGHPALDWTGLDWTGADWAVLRRGSWTNWPETGWDWPGLAWDLPGLDWPGTGLDWPGTGLGLAGDWPGTGLRLGRTGLDWAAPGTALGLPWDWPGTGLGLPGTARSGPRRSRALRYVNITAPGSRAKRSRLGYPFCGRLTEHPLQNGMAFRLGYPGRDWTRLDWTGLGWTGTLRPMSCLLPRNHVTRAESKDGALSVGCLASAFQKPWRDVLPLICAVLVKLH